MAFHLFDTQHHCHVLSRPGNALGFFSSPLQQKMSILLIADPLCYPYDSSHPLVLAKFASQNLLSKRAWTHNLERCIKEPCFAGVELAGIEITCYVNKSGIIVAQPTTTYPFHFNRKHFNQIKFVFIPKVFRPAPAQLPPLVPFSSPEFSSVVHVLFPEILE